MKIRRSKGVLLVALLICLLTAMTFRPMDILASVPQSTEAYQIFHSADDPIVIDDPTDFGTLGFSGNGSSGNPYVISGISISADGVCLDIRGISAYIEIRDCTFTRLDPTYPSLTVYVESAVNVTLENSQINNGSIGANGCSAVYIRSNHFNESQRYGVEGRSNRFYISNNTFTRCTYAIAPDDSVISEITNNTIIDSTVGVAERGNNYLVHNNTFIRNSNGVDASSGEYYDNLLLNCTVGFSASFAHASIIENNITNFKKTGINLKYMSDCEVRRNWISGGEGRDGIIPDMSGDGPITGNTLVNCGINVDDTYDWASLHLVNNTVNGKLLGYFDNATDLTLNGSEYGQIILFKCSNSSIRNGTFVKTASGISTLYSSLTRIENCTFFECDSGVTTYGSSSHVLRNSNFTLCGLHAQGSWSSLTVENCKVNGKPLTLLKQQDNITLSGNGYGQIIAYNCDNLLISGVSISDATVGITIGSSEKGVIEYSNISSNNAKGIYLSNTVDCQVRYCNLTENDIGFYMASTDNNLITNNTISQNRIGVRTFGDSNYFYYNTFFDNSELNAFEGLGANTWDDGISMGNWWDDYSGSGFYFVDFDYGCLDYCPFPYDRFPNGVKGDQVPPEINHPADKEAYKDIPFNIRWDGDEENPGTYNVYINGTLYRSGAWDSFPLTISCTLEELGIYNITIVIVDWFMNSVNDTVIVEIVEPPEITTTTTTTTTDTIVTTTLTDLTNITSTTTFNQLLMTNLSLGIAVAAGVVFIIILLRKK